MNPGAVSRLVATELDELGPLIRFFTQSGWARRGDGNDFSDFAVGNPHDEVIPEFTKALADHLHPERNDWFAYKMSEPEATGVVARSLSESLGLNVEPADIALTNGAFAGLTVALRATVDPGDEVIFLSPPWFFYETIIRSIGAIPVKVRLKADSFDVDFPALEAAISPRTRAIIVNSPHNPTGRIYDEATIAALGELLASASAANGRAIYAISDEAYNRIVFDGRGVPSLFSCYPNTMLVYTYGKALLTPGQRLGYIALQPSMLDREMVRFGLFTAQMMTGYAFPNALMQHAIADLEFASIDIRRLQRRRDLMVSELRDAGYEVEVPEGTFYLLPRAPIADDLLFTEALAERRVFVLPGSLCDAPGYFRISLTATDAMIERALPIFREVRQGYA